MEAEGSPARPLRFFSRGGAALKNGLDLTAEPATVLSCAAGVVDHFWKLFVARICEEGKRPCARRDCDQEVAFLFRPRLLPGKGLLFLGGWCGARDRFEVPTLPSRLSYFHRLQAAEGLRSPAMLPLTS